MSAYMCPIIGVKVLFVFSLAGIIFLSSIGMLLGTDSQYIAVSESNAKRKPELAKSVMGAVLMWCTVGIRVV
jgi:hypothetical protein